MKSVHKDIKIKIWIINRKKHKHLTIPFIIILRGRIREGFFNGYSDLQKGEIEVYKKRLRTIAIISYIDHDIAENFDHPEEITARYIFISLNIAGFSDI